MNTEATAIHLIESACACAMQMMSNAVYILRELPSVDVPEDLRVRIQSFSQDLISTKHDVISETFELQELVESGADDESLPARAERIRDWLQETILDLHVVVQEVQKLAAEEPRYGLLFFLMIESATNIINALPQRSS